MRISSPFGAEVAGEAVPAERDGVEPEANVELELVRRAQGGRPEALQSLVEGNVDALYRIALGLTGDPAFAEDLVQETFLKFIEGLARFEGRCRVSTWLIAILRSLLFTQKRRARREGEIHRAARDGASTAPDARPLEEALAAARELDDDLRFPFLLSYVEHRSVSEIAESLELSIPTVKWRLHEARRRLKERLAPGGSHDV